MNITDASHQSLMRSGDKKGNGPDMPGASRRGPGQEYYLQGSILDESVDILLHKLRGICDSSDEGESERFKEHEIVYFMREGMSNSAVNLRVRKPLHTPDRPWTLCYLGMPEIGDRNQPTTIRTCVEMNCSQNVCTFLQELGFIMDYEFISHGWLFRKHRLKATVSKIYRKHAQMSDQLAAVSRSHLVEVSIISGASNEQAAQEVQAFAEQLKPLVHLDKIDSRRLPM